MNENDSREAHEARDTDTKRIADEYADRFCDLCHREALVQLLQHAWEHGFDYARRNEHGKQ